MPKGANVAEFVMQRVTSCTPLNPTADRPEEEMAFKPGLVIALYSDLPLSFFYAILSQA
uniref:Uncharacterized protein n=1 Tax=Anguilla anguilla TaxID=7936 RepID=A0A0E9XSB8_ANGAN